METPEPPDFEQMSKEELIAFAMPLEEVDLRRRFLGVDLFGAIHANLVQFKSGDVALLDQLMGNKPRSRAPFDAAKMEESQVVHILNNVHSRLQQMSREQLIARIGCLKECAEKRTALFQELFTRLADDCAAFGGANATLSQAVLGHKKGR